MLFRGNDQRCGTALAQVLAGTVFSIIHWSSAPAPAVCAAAPAGRPAKPVYINAEKVMDEAVWIGEAKVLEIKQGRVSVHVTADATRLFKGFINLGRRLDLSPPAWGPKSCTRDMADCAQKGASLLVVALKDGSIPLVGRPQEGGLYALRSWCDYNAWAIYSTDASFGRSVEVEGNFLKTLELKADEIARRYREHYALFAAKQSAFLTGEAPLLSPEEFSDAVRRLSSQEIAEREAAQARLTERGGWSIAELRRTARQTADSEVRARLEMVLAALTESVAAYDAAEKARAEGADAEGRVLMRGLSAMTPAQRTRAIARLRALEPSAGDASEEALLAAWRARLKLED